MPAPFPNVLITGAARRIGAAIARDLAAHGFGVAIHFHTSRTEADRLALQICDAGGRAEPVGADLTDSRSAAGLVAAAEGVVGPISILVNNASVFEDDSALAFDERAWDRHFALHVKAPALLAQQLTAGIDPAASGLVVNIIDQRVWRLTPRYFSYTLSKAALWTATQTMAQAFAPRARVNAIGPGPTMANSRQSPADFAAQQAGLLMQAGPDLDDFGRTIRYLWDTPSITGQMIAIDGGQHLAWQTPDITGMVE